jgi:exodeoxyribonuclease VII small subunit
MINFSQSVKRLEEIVQKLDSPDIDLDEALKLLEEGMTLHKQCTEKLNQAQSKITEILKTEAVSS